jgi:hypothetical protein
MFIWPTDRLWYGIRVVGFNPIAPDQPLEQTGFTLTNMDSITLSVRPCAKFAGTLAQGLSKLDNQRGDNKDETT